MKCLHCLEKQQQIKKTFLRLQSQQEKYLYIIEIGQKAPQMPLQDQKKERLVLGCQSLLYLKVECNQGRLCLQVSANALISAGLAHLLIHIYNDEPPETVFDCPPIFFKEMGLFTLISPGRSSGLKALYQKLQNDCAPFLQK